MVPSVFAFKKKRMPPAPLGASGQIGVISYLVPRTSYLELSPYLVPRNIKDSGRRHLRRPHPP